jgi:hypothetical protein
MDSWPVMLTSNARHDITVAHMYLLKTFKEGYMDAEEWY